MISEVHRIGGALCTLKASVNLVNIEQTAFNQPAIVVVTVPVQPCNDRSLSMECSGNGEDMKPSTTDQVQGTLHELKGDVKEKAGQATANQDLIDQGQAEKLGGKVQKKVGQVEKVFEE
jgi:uncharacterized protein YjbJ (UPF0337 family)